MADFGLARMLGAKADHWSTKVMGTYGYLAPDVVHTGHVTDKTDVYRYGLLLAYVFYVRHMFGIH